MCDSKISDFLEIFSISNFKYSNSDLFLLELKYISDFDFRSYFNFLVILILLYMLYFKWLKNWILSISIRNFPILELLFFHSKFRNSNFLILFNFIGTELELIFHIRKKSELFRQSNSDLIHPISTSSISVYKLVNLNKIVVIILNIKKLAI